MSMAKRRKDIEDLARKLWDEREQAFSWLMMQAHGVELKTTSWDDATEAGKNLIRRQAEMYRGIN